MSPSSIARTSLLLAGAASIALSLAALVVEGPVPSAIVFPVLVAVGVWRLLRPGRGGALFLLVAGLVFTLVHLPFLAEASSASCQHPVDPDRACHELLWLGWLGAAPLALAATAALTWAGERRRRHAARPLVAADGERRQRQS